MKIKIITENEIIFYKKNSRLMDFQFYKDEKQLKKTQNKCNFILLSG
jgi:hypothetical protein